MTRVRDGFPDYIRIHTSVFDEVVKHRRLSLESLTYYVYWLAGNQRLQQWSSAHQVDLGLTTRQISRMRVELRACGLLTMTRAGKQTYSCIHHSPVPEAHRQKVHEAYALFIKRRWAAAHRFQLQLSMDAVTPFFSVHVGAPAGAVMLVFKDSIRMAAAGMHFESKGMDRMKALGLWLLLCNKPAWFNWGSPGNMTKELGISKPTILKHLKELIALKLVYYDGHQRIIGVSRFPEGVHPDLHPMHRELRSKPWRNFAQAGL